MMEAGESALGNITRIENACDNLERDRLRALESIRTLEKQMADAQVEITKPFGKGDELNTKQERLVTLDTEMEVDKHYDVTKRDVSLCEKKRVGFYWLIIPAGMGVGQYACIKVILNIL